MIKEDWDSESPLDDEYKYPVTIELLDHIRAYTFYQVELEKLYFNPEFRDEEYDVTEKVLVEGDGWFTQDHYQNKVLHTTADLLPEVQRLATILENLANKEVKTVISLKPSRGSIDEASKTYSIDGAVFYYDDMESDYQADLIGFDDNIPF